MAGRSRFWGEQPAGDAGTRIAPAEEFDDPVMRLDTKLVVGQAGLAGVAPMAVVITPM
jgi:hypothetical protein